jgi:quercetin dioxygenase-like cupin family protein
MTTITDTQHRVTETPNGVMTTLASPTLGGSRASLWLVEMHPGAGGPEHAFDGELIWAVTRGAAELTMAGATTTLGPGDTAVLPAGVMRRLTAGPDGFTAVVTGPGGSTVSRSDGLPSVVPPWVA